MQVWLRQLRRYVHWSAAPRWLSVGLHPPLVSGNAGQRSSALLTFANVRHIRWILNERNQICFQAVFGFRSVFILILILPLLI